MMSARERASPLSPIKRQGAHDAAANSLLSITVAPIARRRCPTCGLQLLLSRMERSDRDDYENRTFECSMCDYEEAVKVKFR